MRPLFILRPEPGASQSAERARELGLSPAIMPLFEIETVRWAAPDPANFDALLVTSANAVRFGGPQLRNLLSLPVYAVGEASADIARGAGFQVGVTGSGGVDAVLSAIPIGTRLLHLCGADRHGSEIAGHHIQAVCVYRSVEPERPAKLREIEGGVVAVHSPRAGARLDQLSNEADIERSGTAIAAISPETAQAAGSGWQCVEVAERPSDSALLALAARLCQNG